MNSKKMMYRHILHQQNMSVFGNISFYSYHGTSITKSLDIVKECQTVTRSWKCSYDKNSDCITFDYDLGVFDGKNIAERILDLTEPVAILRRNNFSSLSYFTYDFGDKTGIVRFFEESGQCVEIISINTISNNKETKINAHIINFDVLREIEYNFKYSHHIQN